jgi:ankyrin repeat protein
MMDALRTGERQEFARLVREYPASANRKGRGGSTPLMFAALYGGADSVRLLLERGADPNARNDTNATALMYAVDDAEKTALLLERKADPDARSDEGQTPLLIATMRPGSSAVVKLLLGHGASRSTVSAGGRTPLVSAAYAGDAGMIGLLLDGAVGNSRVPVAQAVHAGCAACVAALLPKAGEKDLSDALASAAQISDIPTLRTLREHGARAGANLVPAIALAPGPFPEELLKSLVDDGAEVNAKTRMGGTVLDLARLQGDTPLVHVLRNAGAKEGLPPGPDPTPSPAASARAAIERSLPALQRADATFLAKAGCVSCHNNSLTAMALAAARESGIAVNEPAAQQQLQSIAAFLEANRERALQGLGLPGGWDTVGYILLGMAAANYPAGETTEPWARYLKNTQYTDGAWRVQAQRPPLESSDFQVTATALRVMRVYAPKPQREEYEKAAREAARWLETAQPRTTEDRAFQLLGLHWAGGNRKAIGRDAQLLVAEQRSDGGWAQLSTLGSDAYATGQALVALRQSGVLSMASPAYQRGVRFLVNSQLADGSWFVRSRTLPTQPYFDSGFPHERDQFISAAATNWAVMALAPAARQ